MRGHRSSPRSLLPSQASPSLEVAPAKMSPLAAHRRASRPQQWPSHPPELESARTEVLIPNKRLSDRLDQPLQRSPRQRDRHLPGPAPTTWQGIEATVATAIKPKTLVTTEPLLSELALSATADGYRVTCAAPSIPLSDVHMSVDTASRVLRISNAAEPPQREVVSYVVRQPRTIYAFPSFKAPEVGMLEEGKRIRGHLPTHFWVALLQGEGWVRYEEASLNILGRPPLTCEEAMAPVGMPRFIKLPEDAELETLGEVTPVDGGFFAIDCQRKPPQPPVEPATAADSASGAPPPSRGSMVTVSLMPSPSAARPPIRR